MNIIKVLEKLEVEDIITTNQSVIYTLKNEDRFKRIVKQPLLTNDDKNVNTLRIVKLIYEA